MTTELDKCKQICCDAINAYLFRNVWNEIGLEFRTNIKPTLMFGISKVGNAAMFDRNLKLPTPKDAYFLYSLAVPDLSVSLKIDNQKWYSAEEICNKFNILFNMYCVNGAMFHKSQVYVRYNSIRSVMVIAVAKPMLLRCIPIDRIQEVYLSIYQDSDLPNDINTLTIHPISGVDNTTSINKMQRSVDLLLSTADTPEQIQIYRNGVDISDGNNTPNITVGDYFDFIVDKNITFAFTIDLTDLNENPVFYSDKDKTHKQLIHIPKEYNPDNRVITHNTCDIFVRRADVSAPYGYYLHRNSPRAVDQVTHNDLSVPLFVLDAYRDYLDTQNITLRVVGRIHGKNNYLIREADYIDILYTHSDQEIINFLIGKGYEKISWWKAAVLEKSKYVSMMFDIPDLVTLDSMTEYVDTLGFYQIVNLICRRIVTNTITDSFTGYYTYVKPYLYVDREVIPVVYLNGRKLRSEHITYTNHRNNTITVALSDTILTSPGDKLTTIMFVHGDNRSFSYIPVDSNRSITIPYRECNIYVQHVSETDSYKGVSFVSSTSYENITEYENSYATMNNGDGSVTLTVAAKYVGKRILIQNKYCSHELVVNIDNLLEAGKTVAIPLTTHLDGDANAKFPILDFKNDSMYLNGRYLVKNADYVIHRTTTPEGYVVANELVLQAMDYFDKSGNNILDGVINIAEIEDVSVGFAFDDKLRDDTPVNLYFTNISAVHVDGTLVTPVDYRGTYISLPEGSYADGDIFEIQTSVPGIVKDFILEYHNNEDTERLDILNAYFFSHENPRPKFMILGGQHRIYSTFMNTLVQAIVSGSKTLIPDPDINRLQAQVEEFLYLKQSDLVFSNTLDKDFVDFYPAYFNIDVSVGTRTILDRLIAAHMPVDQATTRESINE